MVPAKFSSFANSKIASRCASVNRFGGLIYKILSKNVDKNVDANEPVYGHDDHHGM